MLIYRIEDKDGRGPYRGGMNLGLPFDPWRQPLPAEEGLPDDGRYRFGFLFRSQLLEWFDTDDLSELSINGFLMCVYNADTVYIGERQAVFVRANARRLISVTIDAYLAGSLGAFRRRASHKQKGNAVKRAKPKRRRDRRTSLSPYARKRKTPYLYSGALRDWEERCKNNEGDCIEWERQDHGDESNT